MGRDEPTQRLMLALHERLAAGDEPAAALATASITALDREVPAEYATAAGFVCFGAGSLATVQQSPRAEPGEMGNDT